MTLPDNIKEEIKKEAHWLSIDTVPTYANLKTAFSYIATKFYERAMQGRKAERRRAFEAGYLAGSEIGGGIFESYLEAYEKSLEGK